MPSMCSGAYIRGEGQIFHSKLAAYYVKNPLFRVDFGRPCILVNA